MHKVSKYELIGHGVEHPDYCPGCGTSYTEFTDIAQGVGMTEWEALNDALEMLAQNTNNWDVAELCQMVIQDNLRDGETEQELIKRLDVTPEDLKCNECEGSGYVTIDRGEDDYDDHPCDCRDDERHVCLFIRVKGEENDNDK